jgi:hypothetical protein
MIQSLINQVVLNENITFRGDVVTTRKILEVVKKLIDNSNIILN